VRLDEMTMPAMNETARPNPLIELSITIIIPSIILMKLSGPTELGSSNARLLALAFPLSRGAWSLLRERRVNLFAVLGLVSILLTGGIGLLQLDPQWLAVKEAAIPALIGIAVLVSTRTRYPLVRSLLYNPAVMNVGKIRRTLEYYLWWTIRGMTGLTLEEALASHAPKSKCNNAP